MLNGKVPEYEAKTIRDEGVRIGEVRGLIIMARAVGLDEEDLRVRLSNIMGITRDEARKLIADFDADVKSKQTSRDDSTCL